MMSEDKSYKQDLSQEWVKAESGTTYLCPTSALKKLNNPTEAELKSICVDESNDPQNS